MLNDLFHASNIEILSKYWYIILGLIVLDTLIIYIWTWWDGNGRYRREKENMDTMATVKKEAGRNSRDSI